MDAIYDIEKCKKTLKAIKRLYYPDAEDKTDPSNFNHPSIPKGCVFTKSSKDLKYNIHATGSSGQSNNHQICIDETEEEGDNKF